MPLFMPQDPPDSLGEFKPLGPAIRSQPKEESVTLEKTGTPGVVRNSKTGRLETNLPEPQKKLIPLEESKTADKNAKLAEEIIANLAAKKRTLLEQEVAEYQRKFQEDIETSIFGYRRDLLNQEEKRKFYEGDFTVSAPRRQGKSLIQEMAEKYAMMDPDPRIVLKYRPDMVVIDDLPEVNKDNWLNWVVRK